MKILSLYAGPPRGGCHERLTRLHKALARRGVIVHAVTRGAAETPPAGLVVHQLRGGGGPTSLSSLISATLLAARLARKERVDGFLAFGSVYAALLLPFLSGRKLITFLRGSWIEQEMARGSGPVRLAAVRWIERIALRASDVVLAVSRGVAPASINPRIIPNDAPESRLTDRSAARALLNLPQDAFIAGTLGLPTPIKSLETVIDAALKTRSVHLALSGFASATSYEASLRERAVALSKAGRAHLLGWVDRSIFLSAVDVLVVASRHEGSPNGLLEAMSAGLPCLGSRVPGVEEVLADDALLFAFGDLSALAARLDELEARPPARADLAARALARSKVYGFDWDEVASAAVLNALRERSASE